MGTDLRLPGHLNCTPADNFHEIFTVDLTHRQFKNRKILKELPTQAKYFRKIRLSEFTGQTFAHFPTLSSLTWPFARAFTLIGDFFCLRAVQLHQKLFFYQEQSCLVGRRKFKIFEQKLR